MDNVVLSRRDCSLSTLHRSSRAHWYSPSSPMPVLSHCFSTHVQNSSFEAHVTTHFFLSSAQNQVTPSHLMNTNFTFFENFSYPSNTFTHVTPFVLILLPYRHLQSWTPAFSLHQPISVVTFICSQRWAHFLTLGPFFCEYFQTPLFSWSFMSDLKALN